LIVSGWRITWQVANWLDKKEQKALSFFKAFKTLIREQMEDLKGIFVLSNKTNNDFLKEFYETSKRNHLKEQRKGRVSVLETLACLALTDC